MKKVGIADASDRNDRSGDRHGDRGDDGGRQPANNARKASTTSSHSGSLVEGFTSPQLLNKLRHIDSEVDDVSNAHAHYLNI